MARNRTTVAYNPFYPRRAQYGVVTPPTTPRRRRRFPVPRRGSGSSSQSDMSMSRKTGSSGGFAGAIVPFKRPKAGKFKMESKTSYSGVQSTYEKNGQLSHADCVYVGHTTGVHYTMGQNICGAILRKLFTKMQINFKNPEETMWALYDEATPPVGTTKTLYVKIQHPQTQEILQFYHNLLITDTFNNLSQYLLQFFFACNGVSVPSALSAWTIKGAGSASTLLYDGWRFMEIGVVDPSYGTGAIPVVRSKLDLNQCKISVWVNSSLKVQNQSEKDGAVGDDADTVNAIPLVGKQYFGKGTEPSFKGFYTSSAVGAGRNPFSNPAYGDISFIPSDIQTAVAYNFKEPPAPTAFYNVKKASGVKVVPGEIKYSKLQFKKTMLLNMWLRCMGITNTNNSTLTAGGESLTNFWNNRRMGVYKLFALEKPINVAAADLVKVAYEVQTDCGAIASFGNKYYMAKTFVQ